MMDVRLEQKDLSAGRISDSFHGAWGQLGFLQEHMMYCSGQADVSGNLVLPSVAAAQCFGPGMGWTWGNSGAPVGTTLGLSGGLQGQLPYTPPHYAAPAIARFKFTPNREDTADTKYTMDEILSNMEIKFYHQWWYKRVENSYDCVAMGPGSSQNWTQITASINISEDPTQLATVEVPAREWKALGTDGAWVETGASQQGSAKQLVIQPRFETIICDFRSASLGGRSLEVTSLTDPNTVDVPVDSLGVSAPIGPGENWAGVRQVRGMWHQYGVPPTGSDGVFMTIAPPIVSEVNDAFKVIWSQTGPVGTVAPTIAPDRYKTGSLAALLGFDQANETLSKRLGTPRQQKIIKEAIVAIPFQEVDQTKVLYEIDAANIQEGLRLIGTKELDVMLPSTPKYPIYDMVRKMKNYVFPPQFDFLTYNGEAGKPLVKPFAMYIFEFSEELNSKDMVKIWQNLPPNIADKTKTATATISHSLFTNDFLKLHEEIESESGIKEVGARIRDIGEIKWIVFKVKQKAKTNYYKKTADSADDERFQFRLGAGTSLSTIDYSYNWPYDFFSLVELVKIEASVEHEKPDSGG